MERRIWIAALALLGAQARAERPGVYFTQTHLPTVTVVSSSGENYDQIVGQTYPLTTRLSAHCGDDSWISSPMIEATGLPAPVHIDISDLRPREDDLPTQSVLVPYSLTPIQWPAAWKQSVLQACNLNLQQQKSSRKWNNGQVLARNWPLGNVKVTQMTAVVGCNRESSFGQFDSSGVPSMTHAIPGKVKLICGKTVIDDFAAPKRPKTPTDDLSYGVHVVQAHLSILPKTGGNGPCGVTLSGLIETDAVNTTVTFFYKNNKGGTTPWRSVKTDHSKTAFFSDFIEFNKPGTVGGFEAAAPGSSGAPASTFAATPSNKDFTGTYQIIGKNIAFESNLGHFSFNCAAPPINGLAVQPAKPVQPGNPADVPTPGVPPPGKPGKPQGKPPGNPPGNPPGSPPGAGPGPAPVSPGTPALPSKPTKPNKLHAPSS